MKTYQFREPTVEERKEWDEWVASQPANVRVVAEQFNPWSLYWLKESKHRVTIISFRESAEDGSVIVKVNITGEWNFVMFDRPVFGVKPEDLEPCEPPAPDEQLGTIITDPEEVKRYIEEFVRPVLLGLPDRSSQRMRRESRVVDISQARRRKAKRQTAKTRDDQPTSATPAIKPPGLSTLEWLKRGKTGL